MRRRPAGVDATLDEPGFEDDDALLGDALVPFAELDPLSFGLDVLLVLCPINIGLRADLGSSLSIVRQATFEDKEGKTYNTIMLSSCVGRESSKSRSGGGRGEELGAFVLTAVFALGVFRTTRASSSELSVSSMTLSSNSSSELSIMRRNKL